MVAPRFKILLWCNA